MVYLPKEKDRRHNKLTLKLSRKEEASKEKKKEKGLKALLVFAEND